MTDLTLHFYDQAFHYKPSEVLDLWTCELFLLIAENIILYSLVSMANTNLHKTKMLQPVLEIKYYLLPTFCPQHSCYQFCHLSLEVFQSHYIFLEKSAG